MNKLSRISLSFLTAIAISCNNKEKKGEDVSFFPVVSFLKSQVVHIDTSLYKIVKIVKADSIADTSYLRREEFKTYARDFTTIPDISDEELKDDYTATQLYDESLKRVVLSYTPKSNEAEIQRQDITIQPDAMGDQVKTIFIDRLIVTNDSTLRKKMLWQVDKRFQIVTIISKLEQPEKTQTMEVIWNDFPSAK